MLQTIREHTQGWIAGIIISLIIISFALWGIHSYFEGSNGNPAVAFVNGAEISANDLSLAYDRLRRQIQYSSSLPLSSKDETALEKTALQALVEIEVLKQVSLDQGFLVSDRQVDNYLQNMPEFQKNGQFSVERFHQVLIGSHLNTKEFLNLIRTSLLIDQPKLGIVFTSFALPKEAKNAISIVNQERTFQYLTIPFNYFLKNRITIYPEQIESYYQLHLNDFKTPEQVKVDYVQFSLNDLMHNINASDDNLRNYYKENIKSYASQPKWNIEDIFIPKEDKKNNKQEDRAEKKAEAIYQSLQKGQSFETFVKQNHQEFAGKGLLNLTQFPQTFQNEILNLNEGNSFTKPIKTDKGYYILRLIEKQNTISEPFEKVKDQVKKTYIHQQAEEKFAELKERLADMTYEHPDSLQNASKTLNVPIQSTEFFSKEKPGKGIAQFVKVRNAAFSNDVLNLRNNSDVLQVDPETLLVLRVNTYNPSTVLSLQSMSHQIEEKLRKTETEKLALQTITSMKEQLQKGTHPEKIARQFKANWHHVEYVGHYSTKVDSAILETVFHMPHLKDNSLEYDFTKLTDGYAIVGLKGIKEGTISDQKQDLVFAEQVQGSNGVYEYELYKQSKVKNAKVKIEK